MDGIRFDGLTRSVSTLLSRRALAGALGLGALTLTDLVDAKKKHHHKKKKKAKLNKFGCVNVGNFCKNSGQCCSGICTGNTCKAHDQTTCQSGQTVTFCGASTDVLCTTSTGDNGACMTTTGNAGYCQNSGNCFACQKDADCDTVCGPHAACVVCAACTDTGGVGCAGLSENSCPVV